MRPKIKVTDFWKFKFLYQNKPFVYKPFPITSPYERDVEKIYRGGSRNFQRDGGKDFVYYFILASKFL